MSRYLFSQGAKAQTFKWPINLSSVSISGEYVYTINRLSDSQVVSSISDRSLRIYDLTLSTEGGLLSEVSSIYNVHEKNISGVVGLGEAGVVATAGEDGVVKVWDLRTMKSVAAMSKGYSPLCFFVYSVFNFI